MQLASRSLAGAQQWHATLDERSRTQSAGEVAKIGGDERYPGESGNLFKLKPRVSLRYCGSQKT